MKKGLKNIAIILIFSFSTIFIITPAWSRSFGDCCGTTRRWGNGGKWETKDSSASNALWPIALTVLGIGTLIYLFKKGPDFSQNSEPQKIYIEKSDENYSEDNQRYERKQRERKEQRQEFEYNDNDKPENSRLQRASDSIIIIPKENKNLKNNNPQPSLIISDDEF